MFPAVGYGVASGLRRTGMDPSLVSGLVICFSTSTTASTNVVFTKAGGGNEALAAVNAVIGNMLGIFLTPAWLVAYLGATGSVDYGSVIQLLAITVIAPMVVGNAVQMVWPLAVAAAQKRLDFGKTGSFCILLLVWSTFSNTFAKGIKVGGGSVAAMIFVDLAFFALFTAGSLALLSRGPARALLRADERDAVAVAMVAGTKTVALGIPIISAAFAGNPKIGLLSLPLICYHAEQILFGSLLTRPLSQWTKAAARRRDAAASAAAAAGEGRGGGGDGGGAAVAVDVTVAATPVCAAGAGGLEEGNGSVVDVASAAEEPVP